MPGLADIRRYVEEARISIDSAMAAAESVAGHGIVPSRDFDNVVEQLRLASDALDKIVVPERGDVIRLPKVR